ncbi:MAG TPA: hypothetical protein VMU05_05950 [Dongiaceae bacterium]|nr:hypothetical protein [Dongiaceae bacterium]
MRLLQAALVFLMLFGTFHKASAKRAAPKPVAPVVHKGVTYSAPNDNGKAAYVVASDSAGKELFRIKVFDVRIDPKLEEDVQWIFITELKLRGDSLLVLDEAGRCSVIDLATHKVKKRYGFSI